MGFFDIEHKNKCPQCGKEMDYLYGKLLCSSCGYRAEVKADIKDENSVPDMKELPPKLSKVEEKLNSASASDESTNTDSASEVKQDNSYTPYTNNYQPYNYAYQNQPNPNYNNTNKKKTSGTTIAIIVAVCTLVIIGLIAVLGVMIQKFSSSFEQMVTAEIDSQLGEIPVTVESMESYETAFDDLEEQAAELAALLESVSNENKQNASLPSTDEDVVIDYPVLDTQSYGMIEFVEAVFGKSYDEVTQDEFASIVYMDFYYNDDYMPTVTYGMLTEAEPEWGEYFEVTLESFDYSATNFSVFPSLHTLYLDDYVDVGSLSGLGELCVLGSFMTPNEIAQFVSPEQLISLTLYDMFDAPNLEGIGRFYNLTSLYINAESVENIDALALLTGLQNLGIYYGDMIMDFQALNSLTAMESLSITSYALDDFSFVAYMPNLYSLSIGDCYYAEKSAWDFITFAFSLQWLTLDNCYIPYSVEKFMALPYMEYLEITECMTGIDMENLTYNENLWALDVTDTTFLKVKNGVWNDEAEVIYIEDCVEQLYEYYPNLEEVYY
ncbi:MAG: hypothetical protein IJ326_04845 [Lachnospiraceae bacterium]|nr:hypothetical protein [Lachnospiraceae bacterium]